MSKWGRLLKELALEKVFDEVSHEPTPSDVQLTTAIAINLWAMAHPKIRATVFPRLHEGSYQVNPLFAIEGWGRVWVYQKQFWVNYDGSDGIVCSRWINGRINPQEVIENAKANSVETNQG